MSTFDGAVIKEQGVTFGVVVARRGSSNADKTHLMAAASQLFGGIPVVAMEQDGRGVPTYFGRPDLVRFLASVQMEAIPWKRYTAT
jgi:hypothetical protein